MRLLTILLLPWCVFALVGCGRGFKTIAAQQVPHSPRRVVVGRDRTGSYALRDQARHLEAELFVRNAQPGDTWIFRWIERFSYSDRAARPIVNDKSSVTIPVLPPKPTNPFDKRANLLYLAQLRRVVALKRQVADTLKSQNPPPVRGTDIWGFFKKAEELQPTDIVAFTDLGDTMRKEVPLNLQGVRVWILGFQSGRDPKATAKRKAYWTEVLKKAGAEVFFHDISQPLPRWGGEP